MMARSGGFQVRSRNAGHKPSPWLAGRNTDEAAKKTPTPKERGATHPVYKSNFLTLFESNDFVSARSGLVRYPG